ncbi:hypothetical protein DUNSADRAFT_824 [Dunaliella salina]|uniref:Encoded protein n=1 Tax=Dunaliella salina TaxID=3046 RepID=A0ABQ7GXT7_DUNSA|nr:hypothetical protein DUNSADRAFT_824 [Dunaliella salina]|eukprot:KAF5839422.1 hypothetical protein DUNSADRAFT_824 [Dunaliella salina]
MSHLLARRRKNSANLDVYSGPARSIRPRPIPCEERMPVVYLSRKPQHPEQEQSEEEQEVDLDPALVEFLKTQEAEHERFRELCQDKPKADADAKILVPSARPVADYEDTNVPAMQANAPATYSQLDPTNTAYLSCWSRGNTQQAGYSSMTDHQGPTMGPMSDGGACKAIAAQRPAGACTMDATLLETLLTKLEMAHFEALQQRGDEWEPDVQPMMQREPAFVRVKTCETSIYQHISICLLHTIACPLECQYLSFEMAPAVVAGRSLETPSFWLPAFAKTASCSCMADTTPANEKLPVRSMSSCLNWSHAHLRAKCGNPPLCAK